MSIEKLFSQQVSRRDFLKRIAGGLLVSYAGFRIADLVENSLEGKLFFSAKNVEAKEQSPASHSEYDNLQPSEPGCYIGFYHSGHWNTYYNVLVGEIGKRPKIIIPSMYFLQQATSFPNEAVEFITPLGALPFMYRPLNRDVELYGFDNLARNKEFRDNIAKYADGMVKYGKPMLLCSMRELNTDWHMWGKKPEVAKEVWASMWQIFQDKSANRFAKWIWEVYCPEATEKKADNPDRYYPGDKLVDWISLKVYSSSRRPKPIERFGSLVGPTYEKMQKNHPHKPIMVAFGRTTVEYQAEWIEDAYETVKSWNGIKAAIYWNDNGFTLNRQSLRVMKEIFKDPYWITAK